MSYAQQEATDYSTQMLGENGKDLVATPPTHVPNSFTKGTTLAITETQIGMTVYDLQSNTFLDNRIHRYEDGTMGAVWTMGFEASSFPERGTGYNYFNGTSWGAEPTLRLETFRAGWPSYSPWGPAGEIVACHDFGASELYLLSRETKGTGDWSESKFIYTNGPPALSWCRVITSGENNEYIHLISNTVDEYLGQPAGLVYSRSMDGGETWDPENIVLDGTGADDLFDIGADDYTMTARGNTVCILIGGWTTDLIYMRSDDNGDSWEKVVVWEHPYELWDPAVTYTDTFFCNDNSAQMCIDYDGHAHVVFGIARGISSESLTGWYIAPEYDGIAYWNDEMDAFSNDINALAPPQLGYSGTEMVTDYNYIGWMQDVDGDGLVTLDGIFTYREVGNSTMPTITVDEQGRRFVFFASCTETYVYTAGTEPVNYRHIWGRAYDNGSWGDFMDITGGISHVFDECVYPQLTKNTDDNLHFMYNTDIAPGNANDGDQDYVDNFEIFGMMPKADLITGIGDSEIIDESSVSQNYPNPFSGVTTIKVSLEQTADLSLIVTSMTGQAVLEIDRGQVAAQTHHFKLDASSLQPGVYFYTVTANDKQVTRKMIVK